MSPVKAAIGLAPVEVPGVAPQTEDEEDQRHLGWGPLPPDHMTVGGREARQGIWLRWEGSPKRTPVRAWVRFENEQSRLAPLQRKRRGLLPPVSRWLQALRHLPGESEVLVELDAGTSYELLFADLSDFPLYGDAAVLRPDPEDRWPLGGRTPVIVSHGLLWDSPHLRLSGLTGPIFFNALRRHLLARKLRHEIKWYAFDYPCWRHPADNGAALARLATEMFAREDALRPAILVGHSMGGLVQRYALNHERFGDRTAASISAGSPHRGALITSLAAATANLRSHVAGVDLALLRQGFGNLLPNCPGSRGVYWDNADGAFDRPSWKGFGLPSNPGLARFNGEDRYLRKLVCLAGDCPKLGFNRWLSPHERVRWAQGHYFEGFENVDPFVPLASASFEGVDVNRVVHDRADHLGWALWPWQVALLLQEIEAKL